MADSLWQDLWSKPTESGQPCLWHSDDNEDLVLNEISENLVCGPTQSETHGHDACSLVDADVCRVNSSLSVESASACVIAEVSPLERVATREGYDFRLVFPEETIQECVPRSRRSHYSLQSKTLYVKEEQPCPFTLHCNGLLPIGAYVRTMVKYTRREDMRHVVTRCKDHSAVDEVGGCHVLRCRDVSAVYDIADRGLSVLVPFCCGQMSEGHCFYTFTFEFVCRSTCRTPLKQKPMEITFSLELNGFPIGTDSVGIKVCSSPYRDMLNADRKCSNARPHKDGTKKVDKEDVCLRPSHLEKKRKLVISEAEQLVVTVPGCDTVVSSDYERMVQEDVAFAQFARNRRPQWWDEYDEEMRLLQLQKQRPVDCHTST